MMARASILIFLAALGCLASWLLGYHQGEQTGAFHLLRQMDRTYTRDVNNDMDMTRDQVCEEIRTYKESIARDLDEHTEICGWPDMDNDQENSN
jgi:hypothetical protein